MNLTKTPPHDAFIGQACLACFKRTPSRLRCAGCNLASYCSRECQKRDWKYPNLGLFTNDHKRFCTAVKEMDKAETLSQPFPPLPTRTTILDERIDDEFTERRKKCLQIMGTSFMSFIETSLLSFEPRCLACGVAQRHIRKANEKGIVTAKTISPCPDCKMSYFCSSAHHELCRHAHSTEPLYGGHDGLSECALNQEMREHLWCEDMLNRKPGGWNYRPSTVHPAWKSIIRTNWRKEFMESVIKPAPEAIAHGAEPLLRVHTELLSPVMTAIYGFELLYNMGSAWTRRNKLIIHILACGAHDHVIYRFEEMMHRLPALQELEVHYFGYPNGSLSRRAGSDPNRDAAESPAGTLCATCKAAGKKLTIKVLPLSSEYAKWLRKQNMKPDLLMAHSLERLVMLQVAPLAKAKGIATLFTSPFREMAEALYQELALDYATVPDVQCGRNPWGSLRLEPARNRITGVHSRYGWTLAGYRPRDV
ncbi:hypothetical protein C8R43DRAFT_432411 [Mycena crocata]|nr:hypothetical protein C8R43DRAFT_432411 [Mycena crocata]